MATVKFVKIFLLLLGILLVFRTSSGENISEIAIDPERAELLKDALGWMTFRKNGELLEEEDLEPLFLQPLLQKYATSKSYRSFVIAFLKGVLPRMTLSENAICDPAYTLEYKDPFNKSVTWHYLKKFTFDAYDDLGSRSFCDYRKGLICKSTTNTCACPADSKMQPIEEDSPVRRCQIQKERVCALIDLAHGSDPNHSPLASNLHHLIFNPERPLSCAPGTQCRFKDDNKITPLCYDIDDGPFAQSKWTLSLGDECVLDLYANPGSCEQNDGSNTNFGKNPGFVCYNFGQPRSIQATYPGVVSRTGICHYEYGPYGVTNEPLGSPLYFRPLIGSFVNPSTAPLRGEELRQFYSKYLTQVVPHFENNGFSSYVEADKEGLRCSMAKTEKMEEAWNYFASLVDEPPRGEDYIKGATKEELESNLEAIIELSTNPEQKVCKVYWDFETFDSSHKPYPSLRCTQEDPTDMAGNDGACQVHGVETQEIAQKLLDFQETTMEIEEALRNEEIYVRVDILREHPEPPCLPSLGSAPKKNARVADPETLEGGKCPGIMVCYQDFSDIRDIYDDTCQLKIEDRQMLICHDPLRELGKCEEEHLNAKVEAGLKKLEVYAGLQLGEECFYRFETAVRDKERRKLDQINQYQLLNWLERGLLCDKEVGLECAVGGTCVCTEGNNCKPRARSKMDPDDMDETMDGNGWIIVVNRFVLIICLKIVSIM